MLLASSSWSLARFVRFAVLAGAALAALVASRAQSPSAADGFDPDVNGNVLAMVTQADGKIIIGGQFNVVRGHLRNNLARLNPDGSLDVSFDPNVNGAVRTILLQPDNRIVIGGDFTTLQPHATGAVLTRNRIARLAADGSVDANFDPNIGNGPFRAQVFALAPQPNGQIVVGGAFSTVQPPNLGAAATRNNLARLNADGSLDASYNPNANATVLAVVPHLDGKMVVGGAFTSFQPNGETAATPRNRIARLNANGTVDIPFDPNANNGVTALAVQRDGKILVGGFFTSVVAPDGTTVSRNRLARLNTDGSPDLDFTSRVEGSVSSLAVQADGAILVSGNFTTAWGRGTASATRNYLARFTPDGALDADFSPTLNAEADAILPLPDGKVLLGGHFTRMQTEAGVTLVRNHLARLNADGSLDADFALSPGGRTLVSVTQADGKIIIGGSFTSVGGATHNYLARLNADGTIDPTYSPNFDGRVYTLALHSDGRLVVGGAFTTVNGEPRKYLARLNANGTLDPDFAPNLDGQVGVVLVQPDQRILVGGTFNSLQPQGATSPTIRGNLLRLNANGTLDTAFDPYPNSSIASMALQPDGKIVIGGFFSVLAPGYSSNSSAAVVNRNFLARINADGTVDTAFNPNPNGLVSTITVQADNKVVVGGSFTLFQAPDALVPVSRNRIARLNADGTLDTAYDPNANGNVLTSALLPDGKLLVGGAFTYFLPNSATTPSYRRYLARLNTDGTVDPAFDLDFGEQSGNRVDSIRAQPDGRFVIGGAFTSLHPIGAPNRLSRSNLIRISANGTVDESFNPGAGGASGAIVNGFALLPDGRIVAVGSFADLGGARTTNIARFNPEGGPDLSFGTSLATDGPVNAVAVRLQSASTTSPLAGFAWLNPDGTPRPGFAPNLRLSGQINVVAVMPDGSMLLGGAFANLTGNTGGNLIRLNADGTLDTNFNPAPNGPVSAIVRQSDGGILVGGSFTALHGVTRNRIARFNADGSLDTAFDPSASAAVNAIGLQGDHIIIGGAFTSLTPNGATTPIPVNYLARLNKDGTLDINYNPTPNAAIIALAIQADGRAIVGGAFNGFTPNGATTTTERRGVARVNLDGTIDTGFNPYTDGPVHAIAQTDGGRFLIGGAFGTLQPGGAGGAVHIRTNFARINNDGSVDEHFAPNPNGAVNSIAVQGNGAIVIGGAFNAVQPEGTPAAISRNRIARITPTGQLDLNFNPDANATVNSVALRSDGSVLVGGAFTGLQLEGSLFVGGSFNSIGGIPLRNLASVNDGGSVNTRFQPNPDGAIHALLMQLDGKLIVGGAFSNIASTARARLARFNADGTLDAGFNPNVAGSGSVISAVALQPDGRLLLGGQFSSIAGQARANLARLNADGSLDAAFTANLAPVRGLAPTVGGRAFALVDEASGRRLVRVNPDGSLDASFAAATTTGGSINSIAAQADGSVIVVGSFTAINGVARARVARLTGNGAVDANYTPGANGAVTAIAVQPDGRALLGGGFTTVAGQPRVGLARLSAAPLGNHVLGVTANRQTAMLSRTGGAGEIVAVVFELSSDGLNWTRLGTGTRVANTSDWQLTGLNLPASGLFYLRARAIAPSSGGTSSGIFESVRQFNFTNPLAAPASVVAQATPPHAASAIAFDPTTGIAARSTIMIVPGEGSVEIIATAAQAAPGTGPARLANLSTRGRVTSDTPLILGFAISGTESRRVLLRAIGPGLAAFGVNDALPATRLELHNAAGTQIAVNEGWGNSPQLIQAATATGAFPLVAGSGDSAALLTLAPGNYTIQVVDTRGAGGVALAEIYDADSGAGSRLVNVSSRGAAGSGSAALISGFVIAGGDHPERVLLRAVGPGLAAFGATGAVADPALSLYDAQGFALGTNDNWVSSIPTIADVAASSGAFPLSAGSKDAAVLATLPTGAYTIQVHAGSTGAALLEIYEVR